LPLACASKVTFGSHHCAADCPARPPSPIFHYARVESENQLPPADSRMVDVAILDMNHGWPNLGHDSMVHAVMEAACSMLPLLSRTGLSVRALSYEVRARRVVPESPNGRLQLYLGTGGPGHLDPRQNDGVQDGSQGIDEDARWEEPLFRLFDAIRASDDAALLAVCHTFGIMCRWSGAATPVLRSETKGGKSSGILENTLTDVALIHPWFAQFAQKLGPERRFPIVDNRLYDLVPDRSGFPSGVTPIGYETSGVGGPVGDAVTMLEFARDREGDMPRVFGVNHHPEIVDRTRQLMILDQKFERGDVSREWYEERRRIMQETYPDDTGDSRLHLTSDYTLLGPLRFHLERQVRRRAHELGLIGGDEVGAPALVGAVPG
jgi:hypothetical protein